VESRSTRHCGHLMAYCVSPGWLWQCRNQWNDWQGKPKYSEKTCPSAALSPHAARMGTRAAAVGSQRLTAQLRHGLTLVVTPAELSRFHCSIYLPNEIWIHIKNKLGVFLTLKTTGLFVAVGHFNYRVAFRRNPIKLMARCSPTLMTQPSSLPAERWNSPYETSNPNSSRCFK
jgi:hypothetical protein